MSRIRTNLITNRMANGAPTVSNGLVISGVTTSTSFSGDGSALTGITQTTINNNGSNRIITGSGTANTLEGEATFTYDGVNKAKIDTSQTYATFQLDGNSGGAIEFYENGTRRFELYGIDAEVALYDRDKGAYHTRFKSGGNIELSDGNLLINTTTSAAGNLVVKSRDSSSNQVWIVGRASDNTASVSFRNNGDSAYTGRIEVEDTNGMVFQVGSSDRVKIDTSGHTLFSGLTTKNDPRNANGITLKSTAGVSFQNYGSNGSRNWRIRPDDMSRWGDLDFSVSPTANSATDWPDAAADKVLTLGYDGTVSKPRNPLFVAQKSGAITGTGFVTFATVIENVGSCYDSSNGRFTAPVAGYYWFCIKINAYRRIDFFLKRNGSNSGNSNREIGQFNTSDQNGWYSHNLIRIFELAANDYVQVDVTYLTQNTDPNEWITFQGYLLQ